MKDDSTENKSDNRNSPLVVVVCLVVGLLVLMGAGAYLVFGSPWFKSDKPPIETVQSGESSNSEDDKSSESGESDSDVLAEMNNDLRQKYEEFRNTCKASDSSTIQNFSDVKWRQDNCDMNNDQNIDVCVASSDPVIESEDQFRYDDLPYTRSAEEVRRDCRQAIAPTEEDKLERTRMLCDRQNAVDLEGNIDGNYIARCGVPSSEELVEMCENRLNDFIKRSGAGAFSNLQTRDIDCSQYGSDAKLSSDVRDSGRLPSCDTPGVSGWCESIQPRPYGATMTIPAY